MRTHTRTAGRALLAACLLLTLAACGTDPYPGEPPGTLHVAVPIEIKGLDPIDADSQYISLAVLNTYDQLYEYHYLKRPFELQPCLAAEEPDISEDGLVYTIRLKPGVKYVDDPCFPGGKGRDVKAQDVAFCVKRLMDRRWASPGAWIFEGKIKGLDAFSEASKSIPRRPNRSAYTSKEGYPEVEGIRVLDDHTIQFELTKAYPQFIYILAMGYTSIYPPEAVATYGSGLRRHAVGTGPYRVTEFQGEHRIVFERNPNFREVTYPSEGAEGDRAKGRLDLAGTRLPIADRVVVSVFRESQPQWLYFMRGYLDRSGIPKDMFGTAVNPSTRDLVPELRERSMKLVKDPKIEVIYDAFNMEDPVLGARNGEKGRAIRRAICLATDDEWAMENLYNNRVAKVYGPIVEEFPEYDPDFVHPWQKKPGETREQALDRARKILAEVGHPNGEGIPEIAKNISNDAQSLQFFNVWRSDLAKIGIRARANRQTFSQTLLDIKKKKAQTWGLAWGADYPDAQNFLQLFYGPNKAPGPNGSNFDNAEFNELYEEAVTMLPSERRTELYRRMQQIVADECPWHFRYRRSNWNVLHPWLKGYRYNDLTAKYFMYCKIDHDERKLAVAQVNRPVLWPLFVIFGGVALLFAFTVITARRIPRNW